ncbi:hypothetical protein K457DRAFT_20087, partial [Linnemannia elongata AG-77]
MVRFGLADGTSDEDDEQEFFMAHSGGPDEHLAQLQQQEAYLQQQHQQQQQQQQQQQEQLQQQQNPIPPSVFQQYEKRLEHQEQQNTVLIDLVKQLQQQLQLTMAAVQKSTNSAPIAPASIHPQPSNHPTRSAADAFSRSTTNPSGHHPYDRFEDPNRPAPEFPSRIESFTGNQLTLDLDEYLSDIELHFINKSCPENKKVSSFVGLLKSGARQWAEQYLEPLSPSQAIEWAPFKAAFRARWRVTHLTTNLRAEIEALRR